MTIRWGTPNRQPARLTDRAWVLIATMATLLAVFTLPRLVLGAAVYVMEAF